MCEQILDWQAFSLWVRAIVDMEKTVADWLRDVIEQRCPDLLSTSSPTNGQSLWTDISAWAGNHLFLEAREGDWLDAAYYYAGREPRAEQIWRYWILSVSEWTQHPSRSYRSFEQWRDAAFQQPLFLGTTDSSILPPTSLHLWIARYVEWEGFAYWVRLHVEVCGMFMDSIREELNQRCPGFLPTLSATSTTLKDPASFFRELLAWIETRYFLADMTVTQLDSVRLYARQQLRADRIVEYWAECGTVWRRNLPTYAPLFQEWLQGADDYVVG